MSTNLREKYQAIVVGGGPAGALLSYLLAKFDADVLLIERQSDFAREFRGEGLSPSGQAMFREAGLWQAFDEVPHATFQQASIFFKGKKLLSFPLNWKDLEYIPRFVSQPAMLEMLVREASTFKSFSFLRGARVLEPVMHQDRIAGVTLRDGEDTHKVDADYVFAADGRFSVLRKATGLDTPKSPQSFDVVWCKIPMPPVAKGTPTTVRGYFGNGHLGLFIPSHDGLLQVGWIIPKGSYKDFRAKGIKGWLNEMAAHVDEELAEHLRAHDDEAIQPFLLDVVCDHYPLWSVPGMTLLGDAAHPMSPVGAQGINIALRDAVVAANHFVPVWRNGGDPDALDKAARNFEDERREEVIKIQKMQAGPPAFLLGKSVWIDIVAAIIRGLSKTGLLGLLTRVSDPTKNPFVRGVSKVKLELN